MIIINSGTKYKLIKSNNIAITGLEKLAIEG